MSTFHTTLRAVHELGPRTREFVLERPPMPVGPRAGQCLSVVHAIPGRDRPRLRPYTLATAAHENEFRFVVDRLDGGVTSGWLHERRAGDKIELQGPFGTFTRLAPEADGLVFAAQGSGMAPFRGHLLELEASGYTGRVSLHVTAVPDGDVYWRQGLEDLAARWPHLTWTLHESVATLSEAVLAECPGTDGRHAYLCGLKELVRPLRKQLKERGFGRASLKTEAYD